MLRGGRRQIKDVRWGVVALTEKKMIFLPNITKLCSGLVVFLDMWELTYLCERGRNHRHSEILETTDLVLKDIGV